MDAVGIAELKAKLPLKVRKPAPDAPGLQDVPLPPPLDLDLDIVDLLLEERHRHVA